LISNVVIFDNRAGGFASVNPEWGNREIRLIEIASDIMSRVTPLGIATNYDEHNNSFLASLSNVAEEAGLADMLTIVQREHLHIKGVLLKRGLLTGSMNLTYRGLELNDEMVVYDTDLRTLAEARLNFQSYVEASE
jgi:phosphatidylserine/phosphatidylglycerophosphate/cardiolipin synthase-like enzyme